MLEKNWGKVNSPGPWPHFFFFGGGGAIKILSEHPPGPGTIIIGKVLRLKLRFSNHKRGLEAPIVQILVEGRHIQRVSSLFYV